MLDCAELVIAFNRHGLTCAGFPVVSPERIVVDLHRHGSELVFEQAIDLVDLAKFGSLEQAVEAAAWRVGRALATAGGSV